MGFHEYLGKLVTRWIERAGGDEAKPVDLWFAGLIYKLGVGNIDKNPEAAEAWFHHAKQARTYARFRAALQPEWQQAGYDDSDNLDEIFVITEHLCHNREMLDMLRRHIFVSVHTGSDELQLGLSTDQKDALSKHIIKTFERLLSPSSLRLPEVATEKYAERGVSETLKRKENVVEFLTRVYKKEIEAAIIEDADLSSLDRAAYSALHSWNTNHPKEAFHLVKPLETIQQEIDQQLEAARVALQHSPKRIRRLEATRSIDLG